MKRVEIATKGDIVDDVTEKLKEFNMTYEELSDFVFDYQECIENMKVFEKKLEEIKSELKALGVEDLFQVVYDNSEFKVYDD